MVSVLFELPLKTPENKDFLLFQGGLKWEHRNRFNKWWKQYRLNLKMTPVCCGGIVYPLNESVLYIVHHCDNIIIFWLHHGMNQRFFFRPYKCHKMVFEPTTAGPYHEAFVWAIWNDMPKCYIQRPTAMWRILELFQKL